MEKGTCNAANGPFDVDVVALADAMIAGYTANPGDFPNADLAGLQAVRTQYQTGKDAQLDLSACEA